MDNNINLDDMYEAQFDKVTDLLMNSDDEMELNFAIDSLKKLYELSKNIELDSEMEEIHYMIQNDINSLSKGMEFEVLYNTQFDGDIIYQQPMKIEDRADDKIFDYDIGKLMDQSLDYYNKARQKILEEIHKIRVMSEEDVVNYLKRFK